MRQKIETNSQRINTINQQLEQEILERSRAQAEVMKLNRFLEEKIRELDLSNKELEAFSYSVSHDLRAPLRSIDGFSLMLLEEHAEKLDETEKGYLHRIRAASQRLEQIIDDLLRLSRIMRNDMQLEPIDLSGLVRSISGAFQDASPNRKVELITAPNVMVMADESLIRLAVENLVNNAWKYTSQKIDVRIEFGVDSRETELTNQKTLCFIRNNGAGFAMSLSDKLFTPFQRLHPESQFPGTGMGAISGRRLKSARAQHFTLPCLEHKIQRLSPIAEKIPILTRRTADSPQRRKIRKEGNALVAANSIEYFLCAFAVNKNSVIDSSKHK